jgi:HK97 gp10 family phage protein
MELEGMNELMAHVQKLRLTVDAALEDEALRAGAEHLRDEIQHHPNMPRSTANKEHAQDHIIIQKNSDGQYDVGAENRFYYLLFHEMGTQGGSYTSKAGNTYTLPGIDAKPFMRPAFENNLDEVQKKMAKVIKRGLGL